MKLVSMDQRALWGLILHKSDRKSVQDEYLRIYSKEAATALPRLDSETVMQEAAAVTETALRSLRTTTVDGIPRVQVQDGEERTTDWTWRREDKSKDSGGRPNHLVAEDGETEGQQWN
jgi:hypothetical protein